MTSFMQGSLFDNLYSETIIHELSRNSRRRHAADNDGDNAAENDDNDDDLEELFHTTAAELLLGIDSKLSRTMRNIFGFYP